MERLESREVMSAGGPSAQAQYMLEQINFARTNPSAAAEHFSSNLGSDTLGAIDYYKLDLNAAKAAIASSPARQPLAWNDQLGKAAQGQSDDQAIHGYQGHNGSDGSDLNTRLSRVGFTDYNSSAENDFAYSDSLDQAMEAFLLDWGVADSGHRNNMLQPTATADSSFNQVGIGISGASKNGTGPLVVVQDFAHANDKSAFVLGVAYNDTNKNGAYSLGEGQGDVTIEARNVATGAVASVSTWNAGGYQIPLTPGTYDVTAKVGPNVVRTQQVTVANQNVQIDFRLTDPWQKTAPAPVVDAKPSIVVPPVVSTPVVAKPVKTTPTVVNSGTNLTFTAPVLANKPTVVIPTKTSQVTPTTVTIPQDTTPTTTATTLPDDFSFDWITSWTWQGRANTK
jgi:uncharacterized protein YkwD